MYDIELDRKKCQRAQWLHKRDFVQYRMMSGLSVETLFTEVLTEELSELLEYAIKGIEGTLSQPKYKRVDLEEMYKNTAGGDEWRREYATGYNTAIDEIKSKYGDLYVLTKEGE